MLRKAVVTENGKSSLYVKSGADYTLVPITTGFNNGEYVEVLEGIGEGEQYYLKTQVSEGEADGK